MPEEVAAQQVELEAGVRLTAAELTVGYRVRNASSTPVLLFNVLWVVPRSTYEPAPLPAYVCVRGGQELHVAQQILPNPKLREVELRNVPFVTRLAAGAVITEQLRFPLPVQEHSAYYPQDPNLAKERITVNKLVFTIQYMAESNGVAVQPAPLPGAFRVTHPNLFSQVRTLNSAPISTADIPVEKAPQPFEEF